jgi:hypothetical protein
VRASTCRMFVQMASRNARVCDTTHTRLVGALSSLHLVLSAFIRYADVVL